MKWVNEFVDERQKSWCIHCGVLLSDAQASRDHVPSKALLRKPWPENLPVVFICSKCNNGFSLDEEYLYLFLNCVLLGTTDPDEHSDDKVSRALKRNVKLRHRIERSKTVYQTIGGDEQALWKPELDRIKRVLIKNARGHAFFELGEPVLAKPTHFWSQPISALSVSERKAFEYLPNEEARDLWPEVGSRIFSRLLGGQDVEEGWVIVQEGTYRYAIEEGTGICVKLVLFEYLAVEVYWEDVIDVDMSSVAQDELVAADQCSFPFL